MYVETRHGASLPKGEFCSFWEILLSILMTRLRSKIVRSRQIISSRIPGIKPMSTNEPSAL
ncbi:MAG: hypothetical protein RIM23_00050 [Coleofasciculus sp. G3-WIS-01]|uniref:hypothetical protein n=1 Tax=Coleofasciculus sp. G3-WIS-01 TaxID=3069528 RepID=UPI0032FAC6C4